MPSSRAERDFFGVRPTCGCITAWLSSVSTEAERIEFSRRMRMTDRDVIRGTLDQYRDKLEACPHREALNGGDECGGSGEFDPEDE